MAQQIEEMIEPAEVVKLTQDLVQIPSQYIENELAQHDEIAEFLEEYMNQIGMETEVLEPNEGFPLVVGSTGKVEDGPTIGVVGHYSTVAVGDEDEWSYDPLGGEIDDGKLYGRGSGDQKGGIAAVLVAAKMLLENNAELKGELRLLMVPGEGCTAKATKPIAEQHPDSIDCDVYIDSDTKPESVSLVHGGLLWVELTTRGDSNHAGLETEDGEVPVNPTETMVDVVDRLRDNRWMEYDIHPLMDDDGPLSWAYRYSKEPIVEVTCFNAGDKVNQIPEKATAQVDIRMNTTQTADQVLEEFEAVLDELREENPEINVSYELLQESSNDQDPVSPDHPIVDHITDTWDAVDSYEPELVGVSGGGRPELAKFGPVIHFGAGGGNKAHGIDENIPIDRLVQGAQLHSHFYQQALADDPVNLN